jgi:hypothetical protein
MGVRGGTMIGIGRGISRGVGVRVGIEEDVAVGELGVFTGMEWDWEGIGGSECRSEGGDGCGSE